MRKDKSGEREKAKLLVLAVLYKIGANLALGSVSSTSMRELLTKAENLTVKFGLRYENTILEAIERRRQAIEMLEKEEIKRMDSSSLCSFPGGGAFLDSFKAIPHTKKPEMRQYPNISRDPSRDRNRSKSRNFIIKKSQEPTKGRAIKTPNREKAPRQPHKTPDVRASTQEGFSRAQIERSAKIQKRKISDSSLESLPRHQPRGEIHKKVGMGGATVDSNKRAIEARRDFKEGLDNLLALGEYVKNEIKELNNEPRPLFKVKRRGVDPIFDDSEDIRETKPDFLDKEIATKIDQLLVSQLEWHQQRSLFQEKLDKLEKNLERQTTEGDENYQLSHSRLFLTPKNNEPTVLVTPGSPKAQNTLLPIKRVTPKSNTNLPNIGSQMFQISAGSGSSNYLTVSKKDSFNRNNSLNMGTPSAISEISSRSAVIASGLEGYINALKYSIHQFEKEDFEPFREEIKQILSNGQDSNYILGFTVSKGDNKGQGKTINLNIYPFQPELIAQNKPLPVLARDVLSIQQLNYILKSIHAIDVLPLHKPASSFTSITFFLLHVLSKFVQVSPSASNPSSMELAIQNTPRGLTGREPILLQFFGESCTVSLIHMNEKTFRLVIRRESAREDVEAIFCELILNDFVMANFFELCTKPTENIQNLLKDDHVPTWEELDKFQIGLQGTRKCLWMDPAPGKKVVLFHPG